MKPSEIIYERACKLVDKRLPWYMKFGNYKSKPNLDFNNPVIEEILNYLDEQSQNSKRGE